MIGQVAKLAILGCFSAGLAFADTELVKLTVTEEAGVERKNEPVTVGVPFVEGAVAGVDRLQLNDETGKPVKAQFTEASKWRTDKGGVRWAHLDFQASIPANGTKTISVVLKDSAAKPVQSPLKVQLKDNVATVITGPVKFVVRGSKFNGFDGAWFDPSGKENFQDSTMIVKPGGELGSKVEGGGKAFLSSADADGKLEIESEGPMKVVLAAKGAHKSGDEKRFDYVVRFYAYADSPVVRVSHTFINRHGQSPRDMVELDSLAFDVPTALAQPAVTVGMDTAPLDCGAGKRVALLQKASDECVALAGDTEKAKGKAKSSKTLSLGWVDAGSGAKHLALGIRWFWQMFPKEIAVSPEGMFSAGLYPKSFNKTFDVYMGQSRTHYLTFVFHAGMDKKDLNELFMASQKPLRPWAPAKVYCRDTHALGYTAETDKTLFPADKWEVVEKFHSKLEIVESFDKKMESSLHQIRKKLEGFNYQGYTVESYGFYEWGDTFHWAWPKQEKAPKDTREWHISWEGNYYDYPNLCLMQMLRTGNRNYYWHAFEPNTIHVRDVFTCQYHPRKELCGACRYCPPRNHCATDDGAPYVSNEFNHNKSQCVFAHWYLTGDWRTREVIDLMMNNGLNNYAADTGFANRGIGAHMALLMQSWELTGEQKYRDRILKLLKNVGKELEKTGGEFMKGPDPGIGMEGLVYAHMATGDAYAEKLLRLVSERWVKKERSGPSASFCMAYCGALFGNDKMQELAWKAVAKANASPRPKDTAEPNRNIPFALYFLSTACDLKPLPAPAAASAPAANDQPK